MATDSDYAFYQGPWTDGKSALLIIGWQKEDQTRRMRVETYLLVPDPPFLLMNDSVGLTWDQLLASWNSVSKTIAESRAQWMLGKGIPVQCRAQYSDLLPYEFSEIANNQGESDRLSQGLRDRYAAVSTQMRHLLRYELEGQTRCEPLRDCLRTLREEFLRDQTET